MTSTRIDVVAYNRKQCMMPSDHQSDKGLPTRLEQVSPGPLLRKPSGFLLSSLGRDSHEAKTDIRPSQCGISHLNMA